MKCEIIIIIIIMHFTHYLYSYWLNYNVIQQFSIECRKTKTKVITVEADNPVNQSKLVPNTCRRRQAREKRVRTGNNWFWFYF